MNRTQNEEGTEGMCSLAPAFNQAYYMPLARFILSTLWGR